MEVEDKFGFLDQNDQYVESNFKAKSERSGDDGHDNHDENQEDVIESNICNLTHEQILSMSFETKKEAVDFCCNLGKTLGFRIRCDEVKHDGKGETIWRQWVCNREGFRVKKHFNKVDCQQEERAIMRTGCKARFCVQLDKESSKWHVAQYDENHNHELISLKYSHLISSYRQMADVDKAQAKSLRYHGLNTSKIMGYMANQAVGYKDVTFTMRDLYNYFDRERKAQVMDGDGVTTLSYLYARSDCDLMFHVTYTLDRE